MSFDEALKMDKYYHGGSIEEFKELPQVLKKARLSNRKANQLVSTDTIYQAYEKAKKYDVIEKLLKELINAESTAEYWEIFRQIKREIRFTV